MTQISYTISANGQDWDLPVTCLQALMMMTGRPLTSLWLCRYALPVDASGATSASDGVLPPRKSCRHSIMRRSFCAASCTSSFLGQTCRSAQLQDLWAADMPTEDMPGLYTVWWSHLLELDTHLTRLGLSAREKLTCHGETTAG